MNQWFIFTVRLKLCVTFFQDIFKTKMFFHIINCFFLRLFFHFILFRIYFFFCSFHLHLLCDIYFMWIVYFFPVRDIFFLVFYGENKNLCNEFYKALIIIRHDTKLLYFMFLWWQDCSFTDFLALREEKCCKKCWKLIEMWAWMGGFEYLRQLSVCVV